MVTWREANKNSLTLTDGQLAHTAPTSKQTLEMTKATLEAEGQSIQEAAPGLQRKMVRKSFYGIDARISAYMSSWLLIFLWTCAILTVTMQILFSELLYMLKRLKRNEFLH